MLKTAPALALVMLLAVLSGCQAWYGIADRDTRRYQSADALADAKGEAAKPQPKLLGWSGGGMEPLAIPGLSEKEVEQYVDSGRIKAEPFYYYHADFHRQGSREDYRTRAMLRYAEKFNRALLSLVQNKEREHNQPALQTPTYGAAGR